MSTLCAGCGHDSITAAIVQAFFELDIPPHSVAKMSGIGCSSKTPAYFLSASHGFNSVHGRMPSIATGASAANRELLSPRRIRRRRLAVDRARAVHARAAPQSRHGVHHREQRRVRPHQGAVLGVGGRRLEGKARRGQQAAADRSRADGVGARRLVRRAQLFRRQGAARAAHQGRRSSPRLRVDRRPLAVRDVQRSRGFDEELRARARVQPSAPSTPISFRRRRRSKPPTTKATCCPSSCTTAAASCCARWRKGYDASNRGAAIEYIRARHRGGEIVTGLLYIDESEASTCTASTAPFRCRSPASHTRTLCPGRDALLALQKRFR